MRFVTNRQTSECSNKSRGFAVARIGSRLDLQRAATPGTIQRPSFGKKHYLFLVAWALTCFIGFLAWNPARSQAQVLGGTGLSVEQLADGRVRPGASHNETEAYLPMIFPSSHAPNLLALPDGSLLCVWFSGTWEGASNVAIVMSQLKNGSHSWARPVVIDHQIGYSYQNPVIFRAPSGRLWLFHTRQLAGQGQANSEALSLTSDDEGKSWSAPKILFPLPGSFIRQPLVVFGEDQWLLPMYYTPSVFITAGAEKNYSAVRISNDQGKTWKECDIPDSFGLVQPNVIKLAEDNFIVFFRSRYADWIYKSTSTDGCDWKSPEPTHLPNNNSSMQATLLQDGHIVMAFNNVNVTDVKGKPVAGPRYPLSVALSADGGKTWPWVRDIQVGNEPPPFEQGEREAYSYPSITQTPDGMIHVAYDFRRKTIKVVSFMEEWVQQGGTVGKFHGDR